MEAAALYAFARARGRAVICFAHVTNSMGQNVGDFEKGGSDGVLASLSLAEATARAVYGAAGGEHKLQRGF